MPRYIVYGAGAIGGAIGASLFHAGANVLLVARGAHYEALATSGLRFVTPHEELVQQIPVVEHPSKIEFASDDVILLCTKSQDTLGVLQDLRRLELHVPICCIQNGVENERLALRIFPKVYGGMIISPANHLEPGVVEVRSLKKLGIIELGRYPAGEDQLTARLADDLERANWYARSTESIKEWKYAKLLHNLGNAAQVVIGLEALTGTVTARAREEAELVLEKAGIAYTPTEAFLGLRSEIVHAPASDGPPRGSSTWQSLVKGNSLETDYLNGEVVLIGRELGIPTPVNSLLQQLSEDVAHGRSTMSEEAFFALLDD